MSYYHLMTSAEAIADERGIDDASIDREEALMAEYYRCEAAMRDVIAKVNRVSMFATIDAKAFENLCHDEMPDHDSWAETIQEAYRG